MKLLRALFAVCFLAWSAPAFASDCWNNTATTQTDCGMVNMYLNGSSQAVPVTSAAPLPVTNAAPAAGTAGAGYPPGATAITGNATGTTGAVVGTLAASATKFTYICGFDVSYLGGTAAVSPVTVAGLIGSSMVYQLPVSATGGQVFSRTFIPCVQSSAVNTAITITTTADGTASAVDVNSWGYQQ